MMLQHKIRSGNCMPCSYGVAACVLVWIDTVGSAMQSRSDAHTGWPKKFALYVRLITLSDIDQFSVISL